MRLVAGKGGVGKTTVTAALALHAAGRGERVLLVSTDPTGALGQIFPGVTDRVRTVAPGLEVVELTRPAVLARWREHGPMPVRQLPERACSPLAAAGFERLGHLLEKESDADSHA